MKVTIYTISDAESDFCKQAKDFLTAHNIQFENKDVEHDRTALSEMLALSDNFSGVPVIVVEEDAAPAGGQGQEKKVLKGFTQQEVEQALGLSVAPALEEKVEPITQPLDQTMSPMSSSPAIMPDPVAPDPIATVPTDDTVTAAPIDNTPTMPVAPVTDMAAPVESAPVDTPVAALDSANVSAESQDDQLKGIMDTLAQNGSTPTPAWTPPVTPAVEMAAAPALVETPVSETPVMPFADVPAADAAPVTPTESVPVDAADDMPNIPDFPQK